MVFITGNNLEVLPDATDVYIGLAANVSNSLPTKIIAQGRHFVFVYLQLEGNAKVNVCFLLSVNIKFIDHRGFISLCQHGKHTDKAVAPSCLAAMQWHTGCEYCILSLKIKSDKRTRRNDSYTDHLRSPSITISW